MRPRRDTKKEHEEEKLNSPFRVSPSCPFVGSPSSSLIRESVIFPRITQTVKRIPQAVKRIPQTVERIPQAVKRIPQTVERIPQAVERIPQTVERIPQAVERIPQTVKRARDGGKSAFFGWITSDTPDFQPFSRIFLSCGLSHGPVRR